MMDDYYRLKNMKEQQKTDKDYRYKDSSKKRLLTNIDKKFKTTIIGSLAVFEEYFGHLWGHGTEVEELSEREKEFRKLWLEARSKILDNGNSNLRAAQSEIAQYTMTWDRYVTELMIVPPKKEN
jgi:hypothetical protein